MLSGAKWSGPRQGVQISALPLTTDCRLGSPEAATKKFALKGVHYVSTPSKGRGRKEDWTEREVERQGLITKPGPHSGTAVIPWLCLGTGCRLPRRYDQARLLSVPEADARGADSWRLSADCTPCSWAQSLLEGTSGQHTCVYHTGYYLVQAI